MKFVPAQAPTWHPDVRFFEVRDASGKAIGQFYMDLYARETKRGGAWMDDAITRRKKRDHVQNPVAYLNCNFSRPVGKPALFTHDEVLTLFHEFGHGLHHLLTRVDDLGVSGINGVEWDAVELPSQFMENFCWEWDVLREMTRHVDTGQPLPKSSTTACSRRRISRAGWRCCVRSSSRCSTCACIRLRSGGGRSALDLLNEVRKQVAVLAGYNRFPNSFGHIFAAVAARRLLQLQVGRSPFGGRIQLVRGNGCTQPGRRRALPRRDPGRRRQPPGSGIVPRVPRPGAERGRAPAPQRHDHGDGRDLKLATWNVNSLKVRLPHLLDWLAAAQPDVMCLQETKPETITSRVPRSSAPATAVCSAAKAYNGVAILSATSSKTSSTAFRIFPMTRSVSSPQPGRHAHPLPLCAERRSARNGQVCVQAALVRRAHKVARAQAGAVPASPSSAISTSPPSRATSTIPSAGKARSTSPSPSAPRSAT